MRFGNKLPLWTIASLFIPLFIIFAVAAVFWFRIDDSEKKILLNILLSHMEYLLLATVLVMAALGFLLNWLIGNVIVPLYKIVEETRIITRANPLHRITIKGCREIQMLKDVINEAAKSVNELRDDVKEKIMTANAKIEEEKDTLAALISEMEEGVLVCNMEGQILLYNKSARSLLSDRPVDNPLVSGESGVVGLGRSVFAAIHKDLIVHALEEVLRNLSRGNKGLVSHLVTSTIKNELIRIRVVPILHHDKRILGFILFLYNITDRVEMATRREKLFNTLTYGMRSSVGNIRAAIESMIDFPEMTGENESKFKSIIHTETVSLTDRLNDTVKELSEQFKVQWLLEKMSGKDFLDTVKRRAKDKLGMELKTVSGDNPPWLNIESYSFISLVMFLLSRIKKAGYGDIVCTLSGCGGMSDGEFVYIDLEYPGEPLDLTDLRGGLNALPGGRNGALSLTFDEVINHHDAEIWSKPVKDENRSHVRILLKSTEPVCPAGLDVKLRQDSRPEFYDFDLFHQAGQNEELDNRLLTELNFTVFDTETTGLDPAAGDEIISIGAIRIMNGRLLREEIFEQLVNPRQLLPKKTIEITGIQPEMLEGQPEIDEILGIFHKFCKNTILIAHNAAFDMRFLQMKEFRTGISFINPVLDTLLLSAVVHPNQESHKLENIAARLGIHIIGRHTALGDAIATGEVLLKLIPLLAEKGIYTLRDARRASQDSYYSRAKF